LIVEAEWAHEEKLLVMPYVLARSFMLEEHKGYLEWK